MEQIFHKIIKILRAYLTPIRTYYIYFHNDKFIPIYSRLHSNIIELILCKKYVNTAQDYKE